MAQLIEILRFGETNDGFMAGPQLAKIDNATSCEDIVFVNANINTRTRLNWDKPSNKESFNASSIFAGLILKISAFS